MGKIGKGLFLFILIFSPMLWSAVEIQMEFQPEQVGIGDQLQVVLVVQSDSDLEVQDPEFPSVDGLQMVQSINSGQSSSTRMNFINGKSEFSKTVAQQYDFIFNVTKSGIISIPSFSLRINGKEYETPSKKISVLKSAQNKNQRPQRQQQPFSDDEDDDVFAQLMKQRQRMIEEMQKQMGGQFPSNRQFGGQNPFQQQVPSRQLNVNTNEAFFIYLDLDKKEVYEGEQITANWYIYTRGNLESVDRAKFPDLKGFWKEIIEEVPALQFTEEDVNGVRFRKGLLASHALFPIKAGPVVIDEFKIKGKVRLPTQFGWGQLAEYTKSSKRVPIKVLPLPTEGKPLSFSGAVGQFQVLTQMEGLQFPAQQPFNLKIRFEGAGNAKLIELPPIEWPEGLEVYDIKSESKFFKEGQSFKEFNVLLVAKNPGEIKIPSIQFSYFDPVAKKYETKNTEEISIKITEAVAGQNNITTAAGALKVESENLVKPILEWPTAAFFNSGNKISLFFTILFLIFVIQLGSFFIQYRSLLSKPQFKLRAEVKLKMIKGLIQNKNFRSVGIESVNLIYLILSELSHHKSSAQEWNELIQKVSQAYRSKYEKPLFDVFEYFQIVGFAPTEIQNQVLSEDSIAKNFDQLQKITNDVIKELPQN